MGPQHATSGSRRTPPPPLLAHLALRSLMSGWASRWSSRQSMNSMVSTSKGCDSTSTVMPYAPW